MQGASRRITVLMITLAAIVGALGQIPAWGQAVGKKPSDLFQELHQLFRNNRHDEAVALVRAKAAEESPAQEVSRAMFQVAQTLSRSGRDDESLPLLREIIERFPKSPAASLAYFTTGQIYGKRGDNRRMVAALERGLASASLTSEMSTEFADAHSDAYRVLGQHQVNNSQWDKALPAFIAWKPRHWCGTCSRGMQIARDNNILLCQAHLGQFGDAVESCWRELAHKEFSPRSMAPFLLVRFYAEADQLDDLETLNLKFVEEACRRFPAADTRVNPYRLRAIIKTSASLSDAIENARWKTTDPQLDTIAAGDAVSSVQQHVARWILLRHQRDCVSEIERAAQRAGSKAVPFLELLAANDTPVARDALVRLASEGDVYRQQIVCGLIRSRMKDPEQLIAQIVARVPEDRAGYTHWNIDATPFAFRFYDPWTPPPKGSLRKDQPDNVFLEEDQR